MEVYRKKHNSKEKEFFILEILRNKNIARFHEIKEYVRENLKKKQKRPCVKSTIRARLEALEKEGFVKRISKGIYTITGRGRLRYESEAKRYKIKDAVNVRDIEDVDGVIDEIASLKQFFSYSVVISGKFSKKIVPKKFFEHIGEEFSELKDTDGGYQVYYFNTGYSFLITVFPDRFWFFAPAFEAGNEGKIVDYGADFVWRFLLTGLNYYIYQLGSFALSKDVSTMISYVLFVDYVKGEVFVDEVNRDWINYLTKSIKIDLEKLRKIEIAEYKLALSYNYEIDERVKKLWDAFSQKFNEKFKKVKVNITVQFMPHADYLTACSILNDYIPSSSLQLSHGGKCTVLFDHDLLKKKDDSSVLFTFAHSIMRCLYPDKEEEELIKEVSEFLKEELGVEKE